MIILASDHAGYELKEYLKQYFTKHKQANPVILSRVLINNAICFTNFKS